MSFEVRKVLNSLPATLVPNTVYYVRQGGGFTEYVSTSTGLVAIPHLTRNQIEWSNRWTLATNNRWNGFGVNRGHRETNLQQNGGTGAEPNVIWNQIGPLMRPNMRLTRFQIAGTVNNAQATGLDYRLFYQEGPWGTWNTAGETARTQITAGTFDTITTNQSRTPYIDLDFSIPGPGQGYLIMFIRPIGTLTANRFARLTCCLDYDLDPPF